MISRTEILRLAPCDPDGPLRESHSSLVIRTAQENSVSPALLLVEKYSSRKKERTTRSMGSAMGQSLNGLGSYTVDLVKRTEKLTKLRNLRASTTLAFSAFSSKNGLLRTGLVWSPELLRSCKPAYYPLLYALDPVRVCLDSKTPLISWCPQCQNRLPSLSGSSRIGECAKCRASLADTRYKRCKGDPVAGSIKNLEFEVWIAQQLGDFIAFQANHSLHEIPDFSDTLKYWFDKFEIPRSSNGARALGVSQPAASVWFSTRSIPKLRGTLGLCWVFGLTLHEFLHRDLPANHDGRLRLPPENRGSQHVLLPRRKIERTDLEYQLSDILRDNLYALLSFSEICVKILKRNSVLVRKCFPKYARQIAKRYMANRRLLAEIRREQFCTSIKTVARFLNSRNITPNHKSLAQYLDQPTRLRCNWAIMALQEVRSELGYEDEGEQLFLPV